MDSINQILYAIDTINSNELIAEGTTISVYEQWVDKMTFLMEHAENFEDLEIVQEAKSVGTGVTSSKGDSLIRRIWDFIRKVVHAVINKISDIATKIKIHNYEYVEIPMEYNDIKADVDDISGIWDGIAGLLIHEDTSDIENYDYSKDVDETKKLLAKAKYLRILTVKSDNKRYGVKPEVFMKMRDKLRYLNQQLKDISKRTDAFIKASEKMGAFKNKSYEQYCRATQQLFAKMHEASAKLFASFKFKNATKFDPTTVLRTINNTENAANTLNMIAGEFFKESVLFVETAQPFNQWLKKNNYDSSNNTVEYEGKRVKLPKVMSKKEINRANKFLRENKYDPKTETIETDIKNKDGSYLRREFKLDPRGTFRADNKLHVMDANTGTVTMSVTGPTGITSPEVASNWTFKHEEGHDNQEHKVRDEFLDAWEKVADGGGYNHDVFKDITSRHGIDKEVFDAINQHHSSKFTDHDKPSEYDADLYGLQHNRYAANGEGLKPIRRMIAERTKYLKKLGEKYGRTTDDIDKYAAAYMFNRRLGVLNKNLREEEKALAELQEYLKSTNNDVGFIEKLKIRLVGIRKHKKTLKDIENEINDTISLHERYLSGDKTGLNEYGMNLIKKRVNEVTKIIKDEENLISELKSREDFLKMFSDEAGSKARKLEGRQGKHKGKHK